MLLSLPDRQKNRSSIAYWMKVATDVEANVRYGKPLPPDSQRGLDLFLTRRNVSGAEPQLRALQGETTLLERNYLQRLKEAAPNSLSCFAEFINPDKPPAPHQEWLCDKLQAFERRDILRGAISTPPGHAKALALDTPLPTPDGWTTIGKVQVGDWIIGSTGRPVKVIAKSEIFTGRDCYRAITDDGAEIVCDAEHLWTTRLCRKGKAWSTRTTQELFERQSRMREFRRPRLPEMTAVERDEQHLPIDPYVLGVWLGDGTKDSGQWTCGTRDQQEMIANVTDAGVAVARHKDPISLHLLDIRGDLNRLNLLGNKHIPRQYIDASVEQRLLLVQGLMDTDGCAHKDGTSVFTNTNRAIIDGLREILWSLGVPNFLDDGVGKLYDQECSVFWRVSFSVSWAFKLTRKAERVKHKTSRRVGRYLRFEETPSVPTQCIAVDSPDRLFVAGRGHILTHNTYYCSQLFPAWYLGRNPRHRYLQAGHSQNFAENTFGKPVRDLVADPRFQEVFPDVSLSPRSTAAGHWRLNSPPGGYVTKGVGQALAGYRGEAGGVDDPFGSKEDAQSQLIRQKVWDWFTVDFLTRFFGPAFVFIIATRWHPDDLIGRIEQLNKQGKSLPWEIVNLTAIVEDEVEAALDPLGRDIGEPLWADLFPPERLMEFKALMPSSDWWSLYKGKPRVAEGNVVKLSWLHRYDEVPRNVVVDGRVTERKVKRITMSVDTANKASQRAKYTVATIWVEDMNGRHHLAHVTRRKVEYADLITMLEDLAIEWNVSTMLVEDKGNGASYIQQRAGKAPCTIIPIVPEKDGDKEQRFDAVTTMLQGGEALFPKRAPWLTDYEDELLEFPNSTYNDQVDSTSQYLNWISSRKARRTTKLRGAAMAR